MKTKKQNILKKKPRETGTWYRSLIEGQNKAEYYRHFTKKLRDIIAENFGEAETRRVLKALETSAIQIPSIETFLFDYNDINETSLTLYNTCNSIDEFMTKSIIALKKRSETGETNIPIRDFFFILSDMLKTNELCPASTIEAALKNFVTALITIKDKSPFDFTLVEPQWAKEIGKQLGLNTDKYFFIFKTLLSILQALMYEIKDIRAYLPTLQIIYPVYYDVRDNQITYIAERFRLRDRKSTVKKVLQDIPNLSKDTPQLRSSLEYLRSYSNLPFLQIEPIIMKLQCMGKETYLKRYPDQNSLSKVFSIRELPRNYYNTFDIHPVFEDKERFEECIVPYFSDVQINCAKIKKENIESYIDIAKIINLAKGYYVKNKRDINSLTFKITLLNVKEVNNEFVEFIRNKLKRIKSSTNKNFIIEITYDRDIVNKKIPEDLMTHFRIISDIHADYNEPNSYYFNFGNDFIINCGDTSGNALTTAHWITNYMRKGVVVIGNHFGYSSAHPERDGIQNVERYGHTRHPSSTKREQLKELYNNIDSHNIALLSNTCTEYRGIVIIGTCLYTDFDLYGKEHREECMSYAKRAINDFRLPVVMDNHYYTQDRHGTWWPNKRKMSESHVKIFDPSDHAFYFQYSFEFIKKSVEENKHKPIVIVTHHAPTPYAIDKKYEGSLLNAAFASNLNSYITQHPEIRLWCYGHCHNPADFILGETRLVCCPFGYNNENNFNLPYEYGLRIPISDVKSKKSWRKILDKQIKLGQIECYDE